MISSFFEFFWGGVKTQIFDHSRFCKPQGLWSHRKNLVYLIFDILNDFGQYKVTNHNAKCIGYVNYYDYIVSWIED